MVTPFKHLLLQERCKAPKVSGEGDKMLSQIEIKRTLERRIREIPTLPSVASKVMQILENPVRPLPTWKE